MYSQRQNLDVLRGMEVAPDAMLACGGGGTSPFWRQMMADMFQMPVRTVANREGPALGAAILAGVACGVYQDIPSACEKVIRLNDAQQPDPERSAQYERCYRLYEKLYPAMKESFAELSRLD